MKLQLLLVTTTTSNRKEAGLIARDLVEQRLAACVQIVENIHSIYRWKGELQEEKEFLLLIKSAQSLFDGIEKRLAEIHSYEVPELVALPLTGVSEVYGAWLRENLRESQD